MTSFERASFLGGLGAVTVLALVDVAASFSLLGALLVGVFLAALGASPVRVALVGGYAMVWAIALGFDDAWFTPAHWLRIAVVAVGSAVAVAGAVLRERHLAALARVANIAEVAQHALLQPLEERYDQAEVAVRYLSAADEAIIGGDLYDLQPTPWGLRVLVADVCGHGLEAVDKASTIVTSFREAAHHRESLRAVAADLDASFGRRTAGEIDFASGLLLQIADGQVTIANCGHPDPLLLRRGQASWVEPPSRSRPFGLDPAPEETELATTPGDCLVLYTDGVTEARDPTGACFDLEAGAVAAFAQPGLEAALDRLLDAVVHHTGERLRDDVVLLAVRPR